MLLAIPKQLFMMIFGGVKLKRATYIDYNLEVYKDFWAKIMQNHYSETQEWGSALWNYLHVREDPEIHRPLPFFEGDTTRTEKARRERRDL